MSLLPMFINLPLAPSLAQSLSTLGREDKYSIYIVGFDADVLRLIHAARPCIAVFSITGEASYKRTFEALEFLKKLHVATNGTTRDPSLRTVLIAEHWGVMLERWMEAGIHEFMPAPITPKALAYKLSRHHAKAQDGVRAAETGQPVSRPDEPSTEVILVKEPESDGAEVQTYRVPGESAPTPGADIVSYERIVIHASSPWLGTEITAWIPARETTGFEDTWMAVIPGKGQATEGPAAALFFTGDQPEYDRLNGFWIFRGENPRLYKGRIEENAAVISCSADRSRVLVHGADAYARLEIKKQRSVVPAGPDATDEPAAVLIRGAEQVGTLDTAKQSVMNIADFLDKWKPTRETPEESGPSTGLASGPGPRDPSPDAAAPETLIHSSPAEVLPGYYSGPGLRPDAPEFNSRLDPDAAKPLAPRRPVAPPETDEKTASAKRAASQAPPAAERESPRSRSTSDTPSPGLSPRPSGARPGSPADRPSAAGPLDPRKKTAPPVSLEREEPESSSFENPIERNADARPAAESEPLGFKDSKSRVEPALPAAKVIKAASERESELGLRHHAPGLTEEKALVDKPDQVQGFTNHHVSRAPSENLEARVKGPGQGEGEDFAFKNEAPEGSRTWSMQNDEDLAAEKHRKASRASSSKESTQDPGDPRPESDVPTSQKNSSSTPELGREARPTGSMPEPLPASNLPDPPPEDTSWLERIRKFLASIFS